MCNVCTNVYTNMYTNMYTNVYTNMYTNMSMSICMLTTQHMYVLFTCAYNCLTVVKLDMRGALIICLMAEKTSLSCRKLSFTQQLSGRCISGVMHSAREMSRSN